MRVRDPNSPTIANSTVRARRLRSAASSIGDEEASAGNLGGLVGRDAGIRTRDPLNPIQVRYQTAPHPDRNAHLNRVGGAVSNGALESRRCASGWFPAPISRRPTGCTARTGTRRRTGGSSTSATTRNGHGHTYGLEVTVEGEIDPETGYVMDFAHLKRAVDETVIRTARPAAPELRRGLPGGHQSDGREHRGGIWRQLAPRVAPARLVRVALQETERNSVVYEGGRGMNGENRRATPDPLEPRTR